MANWRKDNFETIRLGVVRLISALRNDLVSRPTPRQGCELKGHSAINLMIGRDGEGPPR